MVVVVIIAILAALLLPAFSYVRVRVQRAQCITNLKSLYSGANQHVQEHGNWPQIDPTLIKTNAYDKAWIEALSPYGINAKIWICPARQMQANDPDYLQPKNVRIDYVAMPFDPKSITPYRWPRQPWFLERGNFHGHGQLIIFTDGSVSELFDLSEVTFKKVKEK